MRDHSYTVEIGSGTLWRRHADQLRQRVDVRSECEGEEEELFPSSLQTEFESDPLAAAISDTNELNTNLNMISLQAAARTQMTRTGQVLMSKCLLRLSVLDVPAGNLNGCMGP